jgi:cytidylate kinase
MQKKHIITIAGKPGSGKSTSSKSVATELGFLHFSSGNLFRAIGKERGIDVTQTNIAAEKETEIDFLVDQRLRDIGESEDQVVIDSRLAWHWIPQSFKVYLDLDIEVAATRILAHMDPTRLESEKVHSDPKEYAVALQNRLDLETHRYKALYDVNPYDMSNYDLIVDSAANDPEQTKALILEKYDEWLNS